MAKESKARGSVSDYLVLGAYKLVCMVLKMLDVRIVAVCGRMVGYVVWAIMPKRRRIVARNLRIVVDPTLRPNKLRPMVRRNIVRTLMNLACSLKTGLMKSREADRCIRMEGADIFASCGMNGHTVVSCIPHAGNWEILARIRPYFNGIEHFGSMYRRLSNPLLEDFVYQSRTRYGCEMYSKEDGIREVLKVARSGGLLGVLSDQFTREGVYVPYFGKVTGVTPLPAILYKRCKGKGHLFSVFTRNTGLGRWDAVLGREIHLPQGCESLPAITMQVNLALEKCQKENILDGFWMHHRWKSSNLIAPELDDDAKAAIREHMRLPYRMLVCSPGDAAAAGEMKDVVRTLAECRPDAQVVMLCPSSVAEFWRSMPCVAHVVVTDGDRSVAAQLDADEIYKDGPFDMLFMFGGDKKVYSQLRDLMPLYVVGWEDHPLAKKFSIRYPRMKEATGYPKAKEYAYCIGLMHGVAVPEPDSPQL